MAAGHDDDGAAYAQSLSESLETQGGKQDGGRHHERTRINSSPAPQWGVATRKYAVEAIGAFFLTFAVGVAVLSHSVFTPLAAGAMLMVMIYAGGHISGGHYNPAVTLAALVRRRVRVGDAVAYWIAPVVGGVVAGVLARAVVNPATVKTLTLTGHGEAAAAVVEVLITFALCYVML